MESQSIVLTTRIYNPGIDKPKPFTLVDAGTVNAHDPVDARFVQRLIRGKKQKKEKSLISFRIYHEKNVLRSLLAHLSTFQLFFLLLPHLTSTPLTPSTYIQLVHFVIGIAVKFGIKQKALAIFNANVI